MAISQPPLKQEPSESAWDLEVTQNINNTEQRLLALLRAIEQATSLNDLKTRIRDI